MTTAAKKSPVDYAAQASSALSGIKTLSAELEGALARLGKTARKEMDRAEKSADEAVAHYKVAAKALRRAKKLCGHGQWLAFLKKHNIAKRSAQFAMQVAEDPDALLVQRARQREAMQEKRKSASREAHLPEEEADDDVDDGPTPESRWRMSCCNMASEASTVTAVWQKEFGNKWTKFTPTRKMLVLAEEAAAAWANVVKQIKRMTPTPDRSHRHRKDENLRRHVKQVVERDTYG